MRESKRNRLQAPLPARFKVPTLVQPKWRVVDLLHAFRSEETVEALRAEICAQYGVRHCLLLDRARTGIYLLAKAMALHGEWLLTSFMYRPTAVLMSHIASSLAFADIKEDFTIDPAAAGEMVGPHTEVLFVTHMYGKAADIQTLRTLADRKNLFLIENAVQIPGGIKVGKRLIGSWGDASLLSFNVDKPLAGLLGGAILTNRDDVFSALQDVVLRENPISEVWNRIYTTYLAYRLKPFLVRLPIVNKNQGRDGVAEIESFPIDQYQAYCPRDIHPLQAGVALQNIQQSEQWVRKRILNARRLQSLIRASESLICPEDTAHQPHSYTYFPLIFKNRDRYLVARKYADLGIETKWRYYPLHRQRDFNSCRGNTLDVTDRCWCQHLLIPAGVNANEREVAYVADCTNKILGTSD